MVLRDAAGEVWVVPVEAAAAVFLEALGQGSSWLDAWRSASESAAAAPEARRGEAPAVFDPTPILASLIRHGGVLSCETRGVTGSPAATTSSSAHDAADVAALQESLP